MVRTFPIDFVISEDTEYQTGKRFGLHIKAMGTNSATAGRLWVHDTRLGDLKELVAPMHMVETNLMGPLNLRDLTYVIPPDTIFKWEGASGSKCRLVGEYVFLAPGEIFPAELLTRYGEQGKHHYTFIEKALELGTDEAFPAWDERLVGSIEPKAVEEFTFDHVVMASVANYTATDGELALRFMYVGTWLDELMEKVATGGLDFMACPRPPKSTTEFKPFTFKEYPITVEPELTLHIYVRNVKGANISPAAGTKLKFEVTMLYRYKRLR